MDRAIFAHYCGLHKLRGEDLLYLAQRPQSTQRHALFSIHFSHRGRRDHRGVQHFPLSIFNFQFISRTEDAGTTEVFSIFHCQFSIFHCQFSIFHFPFSIFHFPFSIVNCQFSIVNFPLSIFNSFLAQRTQRCLSLHTSDFMLPTSKNAPNQHQPVGCVLRVRGLVRATTGLALHFATSAPLAWPAGQQ